MFVLCCVVIFDNEVQQLVNKSLACDDIWDTARSYLPIQLDGFICLSACYIPQCPVDCDCHHQQYMKLFAIINVY